MKSRKPLLLSKKERPLLTYAISRLRPEIFSHPAWVRFSHKDKQVPPETIQALFEEAEYLQHDNPSAACQVLLICAVYENYSGERTRALTTIHKALDLAECNALSQEILWGIWGACAICVQQKNYEQADSHFRHLQAVLYEQNEWVLADYVEVIRQFFLPSATIGKDTYSQAPENQQFEYLLSRAFDWLHQWGFSAQSDLVVTSDQSLSSLVTQGPATHAMFSAQREQEPWHTLKLIFRRELKLDWMKRDPPYAKGTSSLWGAILSSLQAYLSRRKRDIQSTNAVPQRSNDVKFQEAKDCFLPNMSALEQEARPKSKPIKINNAVERPPAAVPVSVHMLGTFRMSIQDVALRLPGSRSLSLLKYLMLKHNQNTPREVLMDVFWPDAAPQTARNNLNVAMHTIRSVLRPIIDLPVILYRDGAYGIAPEMQIWLDVEEFERLVGVGQRLKSRNRLAAVPEYEAAISIYQGDFLEENPYEGWTALTRESLRMAYLATLDSLSQIYFSQEEYAACIRACQLILARDRCREDAHCMLMRCFNRQGQDHLALRQFQVCVEALRLELDVSPTPTTTQLFQQIRQHKRV